MGKRRAENRGKEAREVCRCFYEGVKGRQDSTKGWRSVWGGGEAMEIIQARKAGRSFRKWRAKNSGLRRGTM